MRAFQELILPLAILVAAALPVGGATAPDGALRVELALENEKNLEGLPSRIFIDVVNQGGSALEVDPWAPGRLPELVPAAVFKTPLSKRAAPLGISDFGASETIVAAGRRTRLEGYLDDLVEPLPPGAYRLPYTLTVRYRPQVSPPAAWKALTVEGTLVVEIVASQEREIARYLTERMKVVRESIDPQESRRAAREIAKVRHPAALPFLDELKRRGFPDEAAKGLALLGRKAGPS